MKRARQNSHKLHVTIVSIGIVVCFGVYLLLSSHAATPYTTSEAEYGSLGGGAALVYIGTASKDYSVSFDGLPGLVEGKAAVFADPTHFDDTDWSWPGSSPGYTDYTIDITPEADGSPDGYFFANYFQFMHPSSVGGYGYLGLQNNVQGINGRGDIFSLWGSTSGSGATIITKFSEGSVGWSDRNSYVWIVGQTYRLAIRYLSTDSAGEHWGGYVTNLTNNIRTEIGELTVPASYGLLDNVNTISFHERYSGQTSNCAAMHFSEARFTNPLFDNSVKPSGYRNTHPDIATCAGHYGTINVTGGFDSAIGGAPSY
jgi:hypothetical protein